MASLPPSDCCLKFNLHEGTPAGTVETLYGVSTYVTGKEHRTAGRVLIVFTDVFGYEFSNTRLVADGLARGGYYVLVPDTLEGDPLDPADFATKAGVSRVRNEWLPKHTERAQAIGEEFAVYITADLKPTFLGAVGYCFGASNTVNLLAAESVVTAGAIAHPSAVIEESLGRVVKPLLIAAAEHDDIYPPELRARSEAILTANKVHYIATLFLGTEHGYSTKGDVTNPVVKYAKEKTLADQLLWFSQF